MIIGYIGLGKMGVNMVTLLSEKKHQIVAFNRSKEVYQKIKLPGVSTVDSIQELVEALPEKKIIWLMVSHQAVDEMIKELIPLLNQGDIIIDGGNSKYTDSIRRAEELKQKGIMFMDAGVSGGPAGSRSGACVMIGGDKATFTELEQLFADIACPGGYLHVGKAGAGHFVKMVHNGIEYGMMQALAEGFDVLKNNQEFDLNLTEIAKLYNTKSVIESRLVDWLEKGFEQYGQELADFSGKASHSGEGQWTVETAKKLGIPVKVIEQSLQARIDSDTNPNYQAKIITLLRNQFGQHDIS
jgi:6-phosphogluconate dehydrogenase